MNAIIDSPGVQDLIRQLKGEGELEGRRSMLLRLLRARLGQIPDNAVDRVGAADLAELDHWADSVLSAATLEEVFINSGESPAS